jgi:uncharacterized protein involved in exopolysaccharide biosynthesis
MESERIDLVDDRHRPATPTMRDIIAVPFRQKRLVLISFAVLFVLVVVWAAMTSAYKAEMKILVRRERMDPVVTSQSNVPSQLVQPEISEAELNSEVELVKSPDLLQKVVVANNLQSRESSWRAFLFGQSTPETQTAKGVRKLTQRLKVEPLTKSNLISVSFESSDPQLAAHVLKSLASLYLESSVSSIGRPSGSARISVAPRIASRISLVSKVLFPLNSSAISPCRKPAIWKRL